ncbi:MAG: UUP1 family membrane protein [Thermodesulfobacteriota bacterium]|nr:UUP1 family membrane protein [Thermodesulfobacteriota bacterium]
MNKYHLYILTLSLTFIGLGIFAYKTVFLKFPIMPQARSNIWDIEVRISFIAHDTPVKVSLFIPKSTTQYSIIDENFISRGYGLITKKTGGNRRIIWSARKIKGDQILYYRGVVRQISEEEPSSTVKRPEIKKPVFEGPYLIAVESLITKIWNSSADLETMVAELIKQISTPQDDSNISLLLGKQATLLKKMEVAAKVLLYAGIPAKVVHGIRLQEFQRDIQFVHWLQVFEKDTWQSYDPETGEQDIPHDYLLWWQGNYPLVHLKGGGKLQTIISVRLRKEETHTITGQHKQSNNSPFIKYSLFTLPIETQAVYNVLLMVPLGTFVLVILRNIVGFKTFGTFMPVLIALAFRETRLLWGIVLFCIVVGLGLSIRFYLEHLKLLLVPRLASVLIVVILLMCGLSILTHQIGMERGLSVALFPMVIITMTIERMSILWEERGAAEALQQGLGSLTAATIAYLVMNIKYLQYLIFVFPELTLILLAGTVLMGRYYGYRISELSRFKALAKGKP